jgi:AcrR family transcriptional regulator
VPKRPDPELEQRITTAAVRLLDERGLEAVTMRSVAAAAGTTTPTLYQRFDDRDALLRVMVDLLMGEILAAVRPARSVEGMVKAFMMSCRRHPRRFDLMVDTFGTRLATAEPTPVFDMLQELLTKEIGIRGREREDLALAIASLAIGTVRGMTAAGSNPRRGTDLRRVALSALRMLLTAFRKR